MPGLSQGGRASHREARSLKVRPVVEQSTHNLPKNTNKNIKKNWASHRDARPLTERMGFSKGGQASHRKAGPLTGRPGLSQGGWASHREAGPLTGRPGLSQGDWASHRESGPLTGRLGL